MSITFRPSPTTASRRANAHRLVRPADPPQDRRRFSSYDDAAAARHDHARYCREPGCGAGQAFPVTDCAGDGEPFLDLAQDNALELLRVLGLAPWPTGDDVHLAPPADPDRAVDPVGPAVGVAAREVSTGDIAAPDLIARITLAVGLAPEDPARPATPRGTAPGWCGTRFIDCGRPLGHLQDLLGRLHVVAEFAGRRGRTVSWA